MRTRSALIGDLLTLVLTLAMLGGFYSGIIRGPGEILFGARSDALKNYYTALYHLRYDPLYWHFQGLNYPYGDHILYADAQPALSNGIKFVSSRLIDIHPHFLAVLNLVPLLLVPAACWLLYSILTRFELPPAYAALGGVTIAFLSPQMYRLAGHYGLAYVIVIPLTWYLLLRFFARPRWFVSALIGLTLIVWSGFHLYYLVLAGLFVASYWTCTCLATAPRRINFGLLPHLGLQLIAPALVVYGFVLLTDPHLSDRPTPWEWRHYLSSPGAVFLPSFPPYLGSAYFSPVVQPEGVAYVTPLGTIMLIVLAMILMSRALGRKKAWLIVAGIPPGMAAALGAALLVLLISFGVPFRWFEFLDPALGSLRQFRTVGRLTWIFYYVYLVFCWYLLYQFYEYILSRGSRSLAVLVLVIGISFPIAECLNFNRFLADLITNRVDDITGGHGSPVTAWVDCVEVEEYQAIIPLPYYHLGSETYFDYPGNEASVFNSMAGSLQSGLPLASSYLNRTPLHQVRRTFDFIRGGEQREAYMSDLPSTKDFLLLVSDGPLKPEESDLVARGVEIFRNEVVAVYRLPLSRLAATAPPE